MRRSAVPLVTWLQQKCRAPAAAVLLLLLLFIVDMDVDISASSDEEWEEEDEEDEEEEEGVTSEAEGEKELAVWGASGGERDAGDCRLLPLSSLYRMSMIKCEVSFLGLFA